jgi:hypothetical protein
VAVTDARFRRHLRHGGEVALLCLIDHPDGVVRFWSRSGKLQWNGEIFQGVGALGKITGISKTTTLEVKQVTFELRGVPPDATRFLSADVRNRPAKLWIAAIRRQRIVGEPYLVVDDKMDQQSLKVEDSGRVTLKITVNVGFWSIERAVNKAWTHEEQQSRFPGDSGFSQIPLLASKQTNWRRDP